MKLRPLTEGIDFLGYVLFPTHAVVRRRVIGHCRSKLAAWEREHCQAGRITHSRRALEEIRSVVTSYFGHFRHASNYRVRQSLFQRFRWLTKIVETQA